jgi:hypothetical protein
MDGDSVAPILERMFKAHYPDVAANIQTGREASLHGQ